MKGGGARHWGDGAVGRVWLCGVVVLILLGSWALAEATQDSVSDPVGLLLKAGKATYAQGEPIGLTLEVVNRGRKAVTLQFRTAQRYDLMVQDPGKRTLWRWSDGRMFAEVLGEETIQPGGDRLTYHVTVRKRFPPGQYTIIAVIPAEGGPISASLQVRIT